MSVVEIPPAQSGTAVPVLSEAEARAVRRGVPNPRIPLPAIAAPTLVLFLAGLAVWATATWLLLTGRAPLWVTIPLHASVTFTMFTVLHESTHHAGGKLTWVNEMLGRLSIPFVAAYGSFPFIRYVHIEHHRNTNEDIRTDPDAWTSHGSWWQLPFRWLTIDGWYVRFYVPRLARRPRAEITETTLMVMLAVSAAAALLATGNGWELLMIYLIPQRIGLGVLAWWFDWLPHHDLGITQRQNRFGATRVRVGLEWLMTPLMLYQNYHLVHHLHPAIPFYRYVRAWNVNRDAYLAQDVPIATPWGRQLTSSEYRAWRRLTESYDGPPAPARPVAPGSPAQTGFHPLRIEDVRPLTGNAVSITFAVPDELRDTFRFVPGQHLVLRAVVNGQEVRRTYSICTAATSGVLRIAVKRLDGGVFSTHAVTELKAGDTLEVQPPAGRFTLTPEPDAAKQYAAIAAGSGITPVISMLTSALLEEEHSQATLLYVNRSGETTMFADELGMLARQFEGRLRIVHYRTDERDPELRAGKATRPADPVAEALAISYEQYVPGRLDEARLGALLTARLHPAKVDGWFLCGPQPLVELAREVLDEHGVPAENLHSEVFHVDTVAPFTGEGVAATIVATTRGVRTTIDGAAGETVLDAALRVGVDAPYACMGGACGTCRAKLVRGTVAMETDYALSEDEAAAGYVLTCQSRPTGPEVAVDYDA
jgi:ferredoxin-NADP reductase/fatty acid desaturase